MPEPLALFGSALLGAVVGAWVGAAVTHSLTTKRTKIDRSMNLFLDILKHAQELERAYRDDLNVRMGQLLPDEIASQLSEEFGEKTLGQVQMKIRTASESLRLDGAAARMMMGRQAEPLVESIEKLKNFEYRLGDTSQAGKNSFHTTLVALSTELENRIGKEWKKIDDPVNIDEC